MTSGPDRVLLDTHALLWALSSPARLGRAAAAVIADRSTTLIVSAASGWEIATKQRIGKLPRAAALTEGLPRALTRLGAQELPITLEHGLLAGGIEWDHRDPFDRMIAAQAILEGLPVVTRDPAFAAVGGLTLIW